MFHVFKFGQYKNYFELAFWLLSLFFDCFFGYRRCSFLAFVAVVFFIVRFFFGRWRFRFCLGHSLFLKALFLWPWLKLFWPQLFFCLWLQRGSYTHWCLGVLGVTAFLTNVPRLRFHLTEFYVPVPFSCHICCSLNAHQILLATELYRIWCRIQKSIGRKVST